MMRVKICGMASDADVDACIAAGVDALGFIFAQSPRRLELGSGAAERLTKRVPPFVTTVGVFADDPAELVRSAIERCRLDLLQFSGDEPAEFCGSFGKPTILAARNRPLTAADLAAARAAAVLVDSWSPTEFGGTGRSVDAPTLRALRENAHGFFAILAGGLTPANVAALIRSAKPDAVDARTGVERDGRKDPQLVRAFVEAARSALP